MKRRKDNSVQESLRPRLLLIVFTAVFTVALIASLPASMIGLALGGTGVSYQKIEGTIWRGVVRNAGAQGIYIGDIDYRINPLRLLTGAAGAKLQFNGGAVDGDLNVTAGLGGLSVANSELTAQLSVIKRYRLMGAPFSGRAVVSMDRLRLTKNGCRRGEGALWTDALNAPAKQFDRSGVELQGPVRCEDNDLVLALAGVSDDGNLDILIRIKPDLRYDMTVTVAGAAPETRDTLKAFGFEEANGALVLGSIGVLQGVGS